MTTNHPTPPGWYPDPWNQAPTRWWDGTQWSGSIGSSGGSGQGVAAINLADRDPAKLRKIVRWTQWLVFANIGVAIAIPVMFHSLRDFFDNIDQAQKTGGQATLPPTFTTIQPLSALSYLAIGAWMVFTYRATTMARALGYTTPREPVLSCISWMIPIVNFWWPYQSNRALTRNDRLRQLIGWHWAAYLIGTIASIGVSVLAIFGPIWIPLVLSLVITIGTAMLARTIMLRVTQELCEVATHLAGPTA